MNGMVLSDARTAFNVFRFQRAKRHMARLKEAGRANITTLAAHAVMTGDKFLAAAIMAQLSAMSRSERGRAVALRQELEGVIHDSSSAEAQKAIEIARSRARSAERACRAVQVPG